MLCVIILLLERVVKLFFNIKIIISLRYCFECCVIFSIFANVLRKVVLCFLLDAIETECDLNIKYNFALCFYYEYLLTFNLFFLCLTDILKVYGL